MTRSSLTRYRLDVQAHRGLRTLMSMNLQTTHSAISQSTDEAAVRALYQQMMHGWNQGSGEAFAAVFAEMAISSGLTGHTSKGARRSLGFISHSLKHTSRGHAL